MAGGPQPSANNDIEVIQYVLLLDGRCIIPYQMFCPSVHGGPQSGATFMAHDMKFFEERVLKAFGECLDNIYGTSELMANYGDMVT